MAYILSKLNKAIIRYRIVSYDKKENDKDYLLFDNILKTASEYLTKIEFILDKDKDVFGYPAKVATLSSKQYNYFKELYILLVKIYKDCERGLICPANIKRFNKLSQKSKIDLILTLRDILNSLRNNNEPTASN